jgi:squalene-associated FAD-dependent desaturase
MTDPTISDHPSRRRPGSVVIIGGGLAGMSAAAGLVAEGWIERGGQIDLFEAKRRPGGRAGSFLDADSNQEIDYCQHVAMGCCTNLLHLLRWAGIADEFQRYTRLFFRDLSGAASTLKASRLLPAPLDLVPAFARLRTLSVSQRREVARGIWQLMRMDPRAAAHSPAADASPTMGHWLRRHGQSAGAIDRFWNIVLASALGEHVDAVAILPARKVFVDGFLRARHAGDVLVPQRPLSELFGHRLPQRLRDAGVSMHAGARVIRCDRADANRLQVHFDNQPAVGADAVIAAVPWHALPRLLASSNLRAAVSGVDQFERIPASPISGIHLWLDRPLTELPHAVIVDGVSQWVFRDPSPDFDVRSGEHYYQVVVSASRSLRGRSPGDTVETVMRELRTVFPAAGEVRCLRFRIVSDPLAVFSITPEVEAMRPATRTGDEQLFLAGDWVQTGWPATMESAVISGFAAAEQVWAGGGRPVSLVRSPQPPATLSRLLIRGLTDR